MSEHEDDEAAFRERQLHEIRDDRARARQRLIDRLVEEGEYKHAARLEKCGEAIPLTCTNCGHQKIALRRCDLKHCPACAPLLAHAAVTRYDAVCAEFLNPLFVTFTVKNYKRRAGTTGIRALRRAFTALRRQRWFKRCCRGGVCQFELTNTGKGWHPHGHALIDCAWLSVTVPRPPLGCSDAKYKSAGRAALTECAAQLELAIGRPASFKIRRKGLSVAASAALKEVLKYSLKPGALEKVKDAIGPVLDELAVTRNLVSWGCAYRHPSLKKPKARACGCEQCQSEGTFVPDEIIKMWIRAK
jgi:hypothetical protein